MMGTGFIVEEGQGGDRSDLGKGHQTKTIKTKDGFASVTMDVEDFNELMSQRTVATVVIEEQLSYFEFGNEFRPSTEGIELGASESITLKSENGKNLDEAGVKVQVSLNSLIAKLEGNLAEEIFFNGIYNDFNNGNLTQNPNTRVLPQGEKTG